MPVYSLIDYVNLREDFYQLKISLCEFKTSYSLMMKEDETPYNEDELQIIQEIFDEV